VDAGAGRLVEPVDALPERVGDRDLRHVPHPSTTPTDRVSVDSVYENLHDSSQESLYDTGASRARGLLGR
jgi:hypothetical protein